MSQKIGTLFFLIALLVLLAGPTISAAEARTVLNSKEERAIYLVNQLRAERGLSLVEHAPLLSDRADSAARQYSRNAGPLAAAPLPADLTAGWTYVLDGCASEGIAAFASGLAWDRRRWSDGLPPPSASSGNSDFFDPEMKYVGVSLFRFLGDYGFLAGLVFGRSDQAEFGDGFLGRPYPLNLTGCDEFEYGWSYTKREARIVALIDRHKRLTGKSSPSSIDLARIVAFKRSGRRASLIVVLPSPLYRKYRYRLRAWLFSSQGAPPPSKRSTWLSPQRVRFDFRDLRPGPAPTSVRLEAAIGIPNVGSRRALSVRLRLPR